MGGKSTFIKSLMLSILFSQTLTISFCKTQSFTPFSYIQTYLNIPDCKGKESLFEAEMNRAYKYISYLKTLEQDSELFSFIIMDEIFSSTNPREGLSGAYAIADKLGNYKNIIGKDIEPEFPKVVCHCSLPKESTLIKEASPL